MTNLAGLTVDELAEIAVREFPNLVLEVSGPWGKEPEGTDDGEWICNFKERDMLYRYTHPGSTGRTFAEAIIAGITFARENGLGARSPAAPR